MQREKADPLNGREDMHGSRLGGKENMASRGKWGNCRVGAELLRRVVEMRRGRVGSWTTKTMNSGPTVRAGMGVSEV